jgi:Meckel syndrome type 1 protein
MDDRPYILMTVNSIDSWGRDRIEGYGFCRMPHEAGYHKDIKVETWRPRGTLKDEIHEYFLGGSVRIARLEEIVKTRILDDEGKDDIVNRFGLETENAGTIRLNLNMAY